MDLRRQPPRRPSNKGIGGIVGIARMADKARAYNEETLGDFVYGDDSILDKICLDFLGITADEFALATKKSDDEPLGDWVRKTSGKTETEIEEFNRHHLAREPGDEVQLQRLKDRVSRYAPERTDIRTIFDSIDLDDWGSFRDVDLGLRAPRSPFCRDVAGIYGIARMSDKARASKADRLGEYMYNCPIDKAILEFLGFSADEFREAAYQNLNDEELGAWVLGETSRGRNEIPAFSAGLRQMGPDTEEKREKFRKAVEKIAPGRAEITTHFDRLDLDDEHSFQTVDLSRHPPRSPYDTSVGGIACLARTIDKGRANLSDTLGEYWYGQDSGIDRRLLEFLELTVEAFEEALKGTSTDADLLERISVPNGKSESEIADFNDTITRLGPADGKVWTWFRRQIAQLDSSRTDATTYFELMLLSDQITFARMKAGV